MPAPVDVVTAVHHPLRRRLFELLVLDGPATASRLAERTDQLVGNISHHLKMLAKAGLVAEAPELARDRRERWWQAAQTSLSWSMSDADGDPLGEALISAAEQQNLTHQVTKLQQWWAARDAAAPEFAEEAFSTDTWLALSPDELAQLNREIGDLVRRYRYDRTADPADPAGTERQRVFFFAHAFPAEP